MICLIIFFFSSRRRHTRYWRDWSSDVCSSDLNLGDHLHYQPQPSALAQQLGSQAGGERQAVGRAQGLEPHLPIPPGRLEVANALDRKSTRLNSSHANISYAVFCLKKKKHNNSTNIV